MVRHTFQTKTFSFRKRRFAWPPIKGKRVHKRTVKSNPPNATQLWDEYKTLWRFRTCRNYTEQNSSPRLPSHSSNYSFFFFFAVALDVASLQSHTKQPRNLRARVPLKCNEFSPLALCFLKENCAAKISMNARHAHAYTAASAFQLPVIARWLRENRNLCVLVLIMQVPWCTALVSLSLPFPFPLPYPLVSKRIIRYS